MAFLWCWKRLWVLERFEWPIFVENVHSLDWIPSSLIFFAILNIKCVQSLSWGNRTSRLYHVKRLNAIDPANLAHHGNRPEAKISQRWEGNGSNRPCWELRQLVGHDKKQQNLLSLPAQRYAKVQGTAPKNGCGWILIPRGIVRDSDREGRRSIPRSLGPVDQGSSQRHVVIVLSAEHASLWKTTRPTKKTTTPAMLSMRRSKSVDATEKAEILVTR